jgi:hypothetical protein
MRLAPLVAAGCHVTSMHATTPPAEAVTPFALTAQDGRTITLDASHPTVLVFYRGYW